MTRLSIVVLAIAVLTIGSGTTMAQISIDYVQREVSAHVVRLDEPFDSDDDGIGSSETGLFDEEANAHLEGFMQARQTSDLDVQDSGLTFVGEYGTHLWRTEPGAEEHCTGSYLSIFAFTAGAGGTYELHLDGQGEYGGGWVFLLDQSTNQNVFETYAEGEESFAGELEAGVSYLLHVQGGDDWLDTTLFDRAVTLALDFTVVESGPVAVETMSWDSVKRLFDYDVGPTRRMRAAGFNGAVDLDP